MTFMAFHEYSVIIEPMAPEDGSGFLAYVPDLPGCISDGESYAEAAANVADAIICWIEAAQNLGRPVPEPTRHLQLT
jgi:antitoxin HicB